MPPKANPRRGASAAAANRRTDAATPSESPAPTSGAAGPSAPRPPVQRLQSLKKSTPSGSIRPTSKPPAAAAGPGGEPAKPTLKYKPRAVGRRSKEEREAIEKLEAQRNRERLAEAAAIQKGRARGTGGPGGRGGFGGRGGAMGSAGPLGSGMGARRGRGGFSQRFGGQDSRASSMSRRSRSVIDLGSGAVSRDVSSDESDTDVRISIDQINLDSSDEEGQEVVDKKKGKVAVKGAGAASGEKGLRPIRVERHEHEERVVSVNMESSSSKSAELREQAKGKAAEDDALFVQDDDETPTQQPDTEPKVKPEPTDDDDQTMADVAPHADESMITDDGFLPVQTVKVRRKLDSKEPSEPPVVKEEKSLLRTKEDIEEYERHAQDLLVIKDLLWKEPPAPAAEAKEPDAEAPEASTSGPDVAATDQVKDGEKPEGEEPEKKEDEEIAEDKLSGQLFLMQFPPMTPNLVVPGEASSSAPAATENASETQTQRPTGETAPQPDAPVKQEYGVEVLDGPDESSATREPPRVVTATDWQLNAGRVGKLNVHASGRVTMTWGGISFELDRATAVDFLQEAVIASTPPGASVEDEPEEERKVWAMGQLSGKFTVMPNWEDML